jgi:hypothetical protein
MLPKEGRPDRRGPRSRDPLVALARLFELARRRAGLEAIVLADGTGITIAGAGCAAACDHLAARAAFAAGAGAANDTVPCRLDVLARAMEVRRLRIDGIEVLLCAEGAPSASGPELSSAVSGCQRILSRRKKSMRGE